MYHISCAVAPPQRAGALFLSFFLPPALKYHKSITAPYDRHVLLNDWGTVDPKGRLIFASFHCSGSHFVVEFVVNSKPKKKKSIFEGKISARYSDSLWTVNQYSFKGAAAHFTLDDST